MKIRTATIERLRDALLQSGRRPSMVVSSAYETLTREGLLAPEEVGAINRVGTLAEVELDTVRGAIRGLTDNLLRSGTINVMLEGYAKRLAESSRDARLHEIADELAEDPNEAEAAFALAAAVALADDDVSAEENTLINQLAEWFGITADRAARILDQLEEDREPA